MVTTLGTILGTTLGTELADFTDPALLPQFDATKLYGLVERASTDYYRAVAGGGEAGDAAGFGGATLQQLLVLPANIQLHSRYDNTAFNGWRHWYFTGATLRFSAYNGAGTAVDSPTRTYLASDLEKVSLGVFQHTGTHLRNYVDRAEVGAGTAITGYTPAVSTPTATSRTTFGITAPGLPYARMFSWVTWRGVPTLAHITALFDAVRAAGDIPSKAAIEALMPGTTVTHRFCLREVLAAAAVPVVDGQTAPAVLPDTVTASSTDEMVRAGTPVVKVIDPSADGRLSYGALGFSASSRLETAAGLGIRGAGTGFTIALAVVFQAITGTAYYLSCANASASNGYAFYRLSGTLYFYAGNGTTAISRTRAITAADVGVPTLIHLVHNGTAIEAYFNGVSTAAPANCAYVPAAAGIAMVLGDLPLASAPGVNENIYALAGGDVVMTAGEVAQQYADFRRTGTIQAAVGKPFAHSYNLTTDITANGGPTAGVPATVQDRVGTDHLTRVGTGLAVAQRVERLWSYESTPILRGADGYTLTDYFESLVNAMPGDPAGFTTSVLCSFQTLGAGRRLFAQRDTLGGGWEYQANASQVFFACSNGTTAATSPGSTVTSDIGKLLLFTGVWDDVAKSVRLYAKRVQVSTGSPLAAGYLPNTGIKPMIGRAGSGAPTPGTTIYGVYYAPGIPTLAQVQAQFDAVQATEAIQPVPGLAAGPLINLTLDLAGGSVPSTLADRGAGTAPFTRIGAPTYFPQYARAFGW